MPKVNSLQKGEVAGAQPWHLRWVVGPAWNLSWDWGAQSPRSYSRSFLVLEVVEGMRWNTICCWDTEVVGEES